MEGARSISGGGTIGGDTVEYWEKLKFSSELVVRGESEIRRDYEYFDEGGFRKTEETDVQDSYSSYEFSWSGSSGYTSDARTGDSGTSTAIGYGSGDGTSLSGLHRISTPKSPIGTRRPDEFPAPDVERRILMPMPPLRANWWNPPGGPRNFGDQLTPWLLGALSRRRIAIVQIWEAEVLSIGSLLEPWFWPPGEREKFAGVLWGCGRLEAKNRIAFPQATVAALRGPLTQASVDGPGAATAALGDPGLLADRLAEKKPAHWRLGVFPHFTQRDDPAIRRLATASPTVCLIDPFDDPRSVLERAARCETIAASALHGLIVADALGLRRSWIDPSPPGATSHTRQTTFKFRDYFASIGEDRSSPRFVTGDEDVAALADEGSSASPTVVETRRQELLASFPFLR